MKYAAYPKYKPSGVEWLGDVPAHWEVRRLKLSVHLRDKKMDADEEHPVPYIGLENIESWTGRLLPLDSDTLPTGISNSFKVGNTLFAKLRPYLAKACNPDFNGLCSTELLVLEGHALGSRLLLFCILTQGFVSLVDSSTFGAKMPRANWEFVGGCAVPIPPSEEQVAIADFLDAQTAKVDMLVGKKRKLIEKLKEKRVALISRTVSSGLPPEAARAAGLDPDPRLKGSGIGWLHKVPQGWKTKAIKFIARVGNGSTPRRNNETYWEGGSYPWLNSSVVNQERVRSAVRSVTDLALAECHLPRIKPPAILIGITGQGKTRGMATTLEIEATINQHLAFVKPKNSLVEIPYLRYTFDTLYEFLRYESEGGGSTKGAITCDQIANLKVPVPPIREQRAIAQFLDRETAKIDKMISKVESAIDLLQEYRSALITATVTGKIDVCQASQRLEDASKLAPEGTVAI